MTDQNAIALNGPGHPSSRRRPLLISAVLLLILFGLLIYPVRELRRTFHFSACKTNLKQIELALILYHDEHGVFPPAYLTDSSGQPAHSWRVLLLPYLDEGDLYRTYRFDEPWNGPTNRQLISRMPDVYACPQHRKPESGITTYVAVVGKETIWPEQYSASFTDVHDGASNTIQLLEWAASEIVWLEPRDVRYGEADKTLSPAAHPPGADDGGQNVTLADGSVRTIRTHIDRTTYRWLQTINSGLPLQGVSWPADPSLKLFDFGEPVSAAALSNTDITPVLDVPLVSGRNTVWCATFQMAWDDLRKALEDKPVLLEGDPPLAAALNRESFDRTSLSSDSYVARGGWESEGIVDQILQEMAARFPNSQPQLLNPRPSPNAVVLYSYLLKVLPFAEHFERLSEPLLFHAGDSTTQVAAFGLTEQPSEDIDKMAISLQVTVLDYSGPDEFILKLDTSEDAIVLAKIPEPDTLGESLASVRRRIEDSPLTADERTFKMKETLAIPVLTLNVDRQYEELLQRTFENPSASMYYVDRAAQIIRFHLDERGAHLESEAEIIGENGHGAPAAPPEPRHFVFDRPFLIYLEERGAPSPYFAAWIGDAELMELR